MDGCSTVRQRSTAQVCAQRQGKGCVCSPLCSAASAAAAAAAAASASASAAKIAEYSPALGMP